MATKKHIAGSDDRPNVYRLRYWGLGYGRGGGAPLANAGFTATL
jgi:hypothetical protein